MLYLREYDRETNYMVLKQDRNMFHTALYYVLRGGKRFHVQNPLGDDYDLVYEDNDTIIRREKEFPTNELFEHQLFCPPYYIYDETNRKKLWLDIFDDYSAVCFYELNEYTIVLARIVLEFTDKPVYFDDERIRWFIEESDRLTVGIPNDTDNMLKVVKEFNHDSVWVKCDNLWHITLFHYVFVFQWLTDRPLSEVKYLEFSVPRTEGLGSLLVYFLRVYSAFSKYGIDVVLKSNCTRYDDKFLQKYFNLPFAKEDSNETNTIYASSFWATISTGVVINTHTLLDSSVLKKEFKNELKEYKEAVFGKKRLLGVLVRGTDYITSGFPRRALHLDRLISEIKQRMEEHGYDGIFLATEDMDYYEGILNAFPGKVTAISQERFRMSEFKTISLISELEKERNSGKQYKVSIEDTAVNYFYAIYMLSECESFFGTPNCNGTFMVNSFNAGRFKNCEVLFEDVLPRGDKNA